MDPVRFCNEAHPRSWLVLLHSRFREHRLENRPDVFGQNFVSFSSRMDSIWQIQFDLAAYAVEEERHQRNILFFSKIRKDTPKFIRIFAEVGGHLHSSNQNLRCGIPVSRAFDDSLEISLQCSGRKAAQTVIASKLNNQNVDAPFE